MSDYVTNTTFGFVAQRLKSARKTLITTHTRPDGDAIGSVLALHRSLAQLGRTSDIWLMGPIETPLKDVFRGDACLHVSQRREPDDSYDLIVVLDTGAWSQLEPLQAYLRTRRDRIIGLDHHARGDGDLAAMRIVDTSCASTTQLLFKLLREMTIDLSWKRADQRETAGGDGAAGSERDGEGGAGSIAEALFVGLATDTGWFKYSNADAEAFAVASQLLSLGVNKSELYQMIEERYRPQRLALTARALASLEYLGRVEAAGADASGRFAIMTLSPQDFRETGGTPEDLTGVVNEPMAIGSVQCAILISQSKADQTKISFRAKPLADGSPSIDVNVLAQHFDGGGHPHAAGATVKLPLDEVRKKLGEIIALL